MCFLALFPHGTGYPTNPARLRMASLTEALKHLTRYGEFVDGISRPVWRFASHPRFPYWGLNIRWWPSMISGPWLILCQHSNWWIGSSAMLPKFRDYLNTGISDARNCNLSWSKKDLPPFFGWWALPITIGLTFISFRHTPQAHHPEPSDARLWLTAHTLQIGIFPASFRILCSIGSMSLSTQIGIGIGLNTRQEAVYVMSMAVPNWRTTLAFAL